jgi:phenol hydroxylase P0 protein
MAGQEKADGSEAESKPYVRILGTRLGRFIEFEYGLGDGLLAVELILPPKAFKEFCAERGAVVLPPDEELAADVDRLAWRAGQPGLLRPPGH